MSSLKSRSIESLEEKMQNTSPDTLRYRVLQCAKQFKSSWVELGQSLFTVWKDKLYRDWGYLKFDAYVAKEIGIRKLTALKLLRSYSFLEKEEPQYLKEEYRTDAAPAAMPSYEAIDVLRRAQAAKDIEPNDYLQLKKEVFEKGRDAREVKRDLTALIRQREELKPEEAWEKKRVVLIKRLVSLLKSTRDEIRSSKLLSAQLIKDADRLIEKLEDEMR